MCVYVLVQVPSAHSQRVEWLGLGRHAEVCDSRLHISFADYSGCKRWTWFNDAGLRSALAPLTCRQIVFLLSKAVSEDGSILLRLLGGVLVLVTLLCCTVDSLPSTACANNSLTTVK